MLSGRTNMYNTDTMAKRKNTKNRTTKKRTRKGEIAAAVLRIAAKVGLMALAASTPAGTQQVYREIGRYAKKLKYEHQAVIRSLKTLQRRGFLALVETREGFRYVLTKRGRVELEQYELGELRIEEPEKWDGLWRLLIFDIEEKRRNVRRDVRQTLRLLGFYRLQDSVWVFPYDCEEVLELLRTKYSVRENALFVRADIISNDKWLRRHFHVQT